MHWPTRLAIVLAVLTLLAAGIFLARSRRAETVYGLLPTAPGLREGSPVSYLGVDVGRVERVGFTGGQVLLTIALDAAHRAPVRRRDTLRVAPVGFFGDQVVRVVPGDPAAPLLQAGDTLRGPPEDAVREAATRAMAERLGRMLIDSLRQMEARAARQGAGTATRQAPP